ncbi:MAG: radical SAM protein, partial [Candidatus Aegiribacteria sp.]|nr:radical SAM protein [Candidatus Aegiribacteria sp.]MBD3294535.1 radical SAM protein [Candidatus Fermentibacteria bacterium]
MAYRIREMFTTLQGEGANTGRAVVLCRFSGCNLDCDFCDTDFEGTGGPGGGVYRSPEELADYAAGLWSGSENSRTILCTGGEPLLQLDDDLIGTLKENHFTILLETNGTLEIPQGMD